ncbi:Checkpoint signal transducer rad24-like protein [Drosera capensis]
MASPAELERERQRLVSEAKHAERAKNFIVNVIGLIDLCLVGGESMVEAMKSVARLQVELKPEEQTLLLNGFKNAADPPKEFWFELYKTMSEVKQKMEKTLSEMQQQIEKIGEHQNKIGDALSVHYRDILEVLKKHLIPHTKSMESLAFYRLMEGDYNRYLTRYVTDDKKQMFMKKSLEGYQRAIHLADNLSPANEIRWSAPLNFSLLCFENSLCVENSIAANYCLGFAKKAYEKAMSAVEILYDDNNEASATCTKQLEDEFAALYALLQNPGVSSTYPQQFKDHASRLRVLLKMPGVSSTFVNLAVDQLANLELQRQNLGATLTCIQRAEDQVAKLNAILRNFIGLGSEKTDTAAKANVGGNES